MRPPSTATRRLITTSLSLTRVPSLPFPRLHLHRAFSTTPRRLSDKPAIFHAHNAAVFPFGVPSNELSSATFPSLCWTIADTDCWGILSSSSSSTKADLLATLQSQVRVHPPSAASHPILSTLPRIPRPSNEGGPRDPVVQDIIQLVSFKTRMGRGGDFADYTARYYAIRDEDKLTVRQHLKESVPSDLLLEGSEDVDTVIDRMAKLLKMDEFLELPLVTLSNGQTRRARILRALMAQPELVILEEPFTGLDVASRAVLTSVLTSLHSARAPRVLLVLRPQDVLPPFITHLALIGNSSGQVTFGTKDEILAGEEAQSLIAAGVKEREESRLKKERQREERAKRGDEGRGDKVLELKGVNVTYGTGESPRRVLQDVDWTIRAGERWVLSGHNGSGKSTLLSLVLGDHPRSFTEDVSLFGKPRSSQATATLQANIGHVSPEIANAFPRKYGPAGLTIRESIYTGFDSIFSYRKPTPERLAQLDDLITSFNDPLFTPTFLDTTLFVDLKPGEQSLVLLLRALVKRPKLLVLDEPFAGMDKVMVDRVKKYLDEGLGEEQAVILISHFDEELPESVDRGLKLEKGKVVETW